jgi:hypothetical protein
LFVCGHAAGAGAAPKPAKREAAPPPLRSSDRRLMEIVDQGLIRSATLRKLEAHLRESQVVVYLSVGHVPSALGRTRLIGAGGGWRYLIVDLDARLTRVELLALLGHELQHATEIADALEVIDEASLVALYQRIGMQQKEAPARGLQFETRNAIEMGQRVYSELMGANW